MNFARVLCVEALAWTDEFLSRVPGASGARIRQAWFRRRFRTASTGHIAMGCEFIAPANMSLGEGVAIGRNAFFAADGGSIVVGAGTKFNTNTHINASVGGSISIGRGCLIGPNVVMRSADHRYEATDRFIREQGHVLRDITIGDDVWISANVVILGGVTIGTGAVIGAGAVVTKDIPALAVAVGIPARQIKVRGAEAKA